MKIQRSLDQSRAPSATPPSAVKILANIEAMLELRAQAAQNTDAKSQWLVRLMDSAVALRVKEFRSRISPYDGNA